MGIAAESQLGSDWSKWSNDDHVTTLWQQTWRHKPRQSVYCPQITMSDFVFKKNRCHWAMPDAQNTILTWLQSLITVGPFQQIKLSIQVHRPCMTTSKIFGMWIPCFSLSVTPLALLFWFQNLHTTTGSNFWLLYAMTLSNRLSTVGNPSSSISMYEWPTSCLLLDRLSSRLVHWEFWTGNRGSFLLWRSVTLDLCCACILEFFLCMLSCTYGIHGTFFW